MAIIPLFAIKATPEPTKNPTKQPSTSPSKSPSVSPSHAPTSVCSYINRCDFFKCALNSLYCSTALVRILEPRHLLSSLPRTQRSSHLHHQVLRPARHRVNLPVSAQAKLCFRVRQVLVSALILLCYLLCGTLNCLLYLW
jgi:hypothetical protein